MERLLTAVATGSAAFCYRWRRAAMPEAGVGVSALTTFGVGRFKGPIAASSAPGLRCMSHRSLTGQCMMEGPSRVPRYSLFRR